MRTPVIDGRSIEQFIPAHLRDMFYHHPMPQYKYAIHDGYDPYGFSTNGLVLYLPLWALKGSSFKSVDAYKQLVTVTGALWQPDGRLFDGLDDSISCGSAVSLDNIWDGGGTCITIINPSSDGENDAGHFVTKRWGFQVREEAASKVKIGFFQIFSVDDGAWHTTNTEVPINIYSFVAVTYDTDSASNNPIIYINNTTQTVGDGLTETATPTGTRTTDASQTFFVGNNAVAGSRTFDGTIGEIIGYNRILPAAEIFHLFDVIKWRYQ